VSPAGIRSVTIPGTGRLKIQQMIKASELTDDGLLARMVAGDEDAFTLLYRRRHPAIYRFALRMSGSPAVAEDVTQEVFMTLIRDTQRFDPARGTLVGFLFGVARNHLLKRWEQDRRLVSLGDDPDKFGEMAARRGPGYSNGRSSMHSSNGNGNGLHVAAAGIQQGGQLRDQRDEYVAQETAGRVRQAVATLPENYREVVVLCDLEEMSYEEAAAALECPVGTVRSRLHRARAILLEKLREAQPMRRAAPAVGA
jgi:RNA polymerase sigma-70 factor, ECF subfamily